MSSNWRKQKNESGARLSGDKTPPLKLADARAKSAVKERLSLVTPRENLAQTIQTSQELMDAGRSREAESRLRAQLESVNEKNSDPVLIAQARCALASALETQGRHTDALAALEKYETAEKRARLDFETDVRVRVQLGLSLNYIGDHPKAIALLSATLKQTLEAAEKNAADAPLYNSLLGAIYGALARVYRHIHEYPISRDYAHKALAHFRQTGEWRGLADVYWGLGVADGHEGKYEKSLENLNQALKIIGSNPAPFVRGRIYGTMGGISWFLRRPYDGIRHLEKAVHFFEQTEHRHNSALYYNNLGINLVLVGEWERAQKAFERALELTPEIKSKDSQVEIIHESLAELAILRGDLETAHNHLERAVKIIEENGNKWHATQIYRTYSRYFLAADALEDAFNCAREALAVAEKIGDKHALVESRLMLAEAHLQRGEFETCATLLQQVADATDESSANLGVAGELQRLFGELALAQGDAARAAHHFGRSFSIEEVIDDRYRTALALDGLGRAYALAQPERAAEQLKRAAEIFRALGARLALARTEKSIAALSRAVVPERVNPLALSQLLTLRLAEAAASRSLLLRELAAVLQEETPARQILIVERDAEGGARIIRAHGFHGAEAAQTAETLCRAKDEKERKQFASEKRAAIFTLRPTNVSEAASAFLFLAPREAAQLTEGLPLDPLLRVVELGLTVCALRDRARESRTTNEEETTTGESILPGFIHTSPAMTRLVEEIHKIRSSDVTVLVTGESGTGKELVARAIHTLSSRRDKVFVPFNCTAVPKELTEGYLFGYRRGAFTGAVNDSPGVIRSASNGTLFLDEVGDLPIDVQPKILRFLQEGEIQPLGEQRPLQVDVRIIAATNNDLEKMVAEGRFREDLYYRLNVIRLQVPPLRERRSEIPNIVNYYVNHYSKRFGRRDIEFLPQTIDLLMVHDWPGNVRQLCNELQRIIARAENGTRITPDHLSPELRRANAPSLQANAASNSSFAAEMRALNGSNAADYINAGEIPPPENLSLADALAELEQRMIAAAMRKHRGNISRAARELGLTRRGLYLKLERYNLSVQA
jgi:hydrogenase-4 transcriptional activator